MMRIRDTAAVVGTVSLAVGLVLSQTAISADTKLSDSTCAALSGHTVGATRIGLPSGDAKITSASIAPAMAAGTNPQRQPTPAMPEYCKVLGSIAPIDPTAPSIKFQINLPITWNGKAVQYGGGGFNGVLVTGLAPLRDAPPDVPPPLALGYVTLGTDSGHDAAALQNSGLRAK
jgi:Tannase and feruloyl esterase